MALIKEERLIVAFAVWAECDVCKGKGRVPGGQVEFGEVVNCLVCAGKGKVLGEASPDDLTEALRGFARQIIKSALDSMKGLR